MEATTATTSYVTKSAGDCEPNDENEGGDCVVVGGVL